MKIIRVFIIISIICMLAGSLNAQETWKNYSTEDGLPANEIRAITEDANGIKWFGTEGGGVAKLDGDIWTVYDEDNGLVYNKARELAIDRDDVLWVGTPRGVSSFDGTKWTTYTTKTADWRVIMLSRLLSMRTTLSGLGPMERELPDLTVKIG